MTTKTKTINTSAFIESYLITEVGKLKTASPYFCFTLIGIGIETLGAFLDANPLDTDYQSKKRFEKGISLFDPKYYSQTETLYKGLR